MTFSAYLRPTVYEQPRPVDGEYPATVYPTYAEFEYAGFKVLAEIPPGRMNVNGNQGTVTIKGDSVEINWTSQR